MLGDQLQPNERSRGGSPACKFTGSSGVECHSPLRGFPNARLRRTAAGSNAMDDQSQAIDQVLDLHRLSVWRSRHLGSSANGLPDQSPACLTVECLIGQHCEEFAVQSDLAWLVDRQFGADRLDKH